MQTATFIVVLVILILVAYFTAKVNRILARADEVMTIVHRIYNLLRP